MWAMSAARKHHYVPEFLLRRFADPKTGQLHQLDKRTGKPSKINPRDAAQQRDYYRLKDNTVSFDPEAYFDVWETKAADVIRAMAAEHAPPNSAQRFYTAGFVALLLQRGPVGLGRHEAAWEVGQRAFMNEAILASKETFRSAMGDALASMDDEHVERLRCFYVEKWETGEAAVVMPDDWPVLSMIANLDKSIAVVRGMSWRLLIAAEPAAFVISDTPVATYDPVMSKADPSWGSGLMSSDHAETSVPLDPQHCLVLSPAGPSWQCADAATDLVERLNLRTYAWGDRWIYGHSQKAVQGVREDAKRRRGEVAELRPRPGNLIVTDVGPNRPVGRDPRRYGLPHRRRGR